MRTRQDGRVLLPEEFGRGGGRWKGTKRLIEGTVMVLHFMVLLQE